MSESDSDNEMMPPVPTAASKSKAPSNNKEKPMKKKTGDSVSTKERVTANPKYSVMVQTAIGTLNERGGSSAQAIKKYIAVTYNLEPVKVTTMVKKYLRSAVTNGELIQTKGSGAIGSFKIPVKKSVPVAKPKSPKKSVQKKKIVATANVKKIKKAAGSSSTTKKVTVSIVRKRKSLAVDAKPAKGVAKAAGSPKKKSALPKAKAVKAVKSKK